MIADGFIPQITTRTAQNPKTIANDYYYSITPMGLTESLPFPSTFEKVHPVDPKITPLGASVPGAEPSTKSSIQLVVREKLFSWSGDSFKIKTKSGVPYNGLKIMGKAFSLRDRMTLVDENDRPIAVCLRQFKIIGQTFKIYATKPLLTGQRPDDGMQDGKSLLYTYCKVERVGHSHHKVTFANEPNPSFTIHRAGGFWPKKRVVKRHGMPAALMEGGTWGDAKNSYLLTINPGIDPCLIVCLAAICDEMDED